VAQRVIVKDIYVGLNELIFCSKKVYESNSKGRNESYIIEDKASNEKDHASIQDLIVFRKIGSVFLIIFPMRPPSSVHWRTIPS
jgi:hypothetical protein